MRGLERFFLAMTEIVLANKLVPYTETDGRLPLGQTRAVRRG